MGITTVERTFAGQPANIRVADVYAVFDNPADELYAPFGTVANPLSLDSTTGAFHNDGLGSDIPPTQAFVDAIPSLQWDTYMAIGLDIIPNGAPMDDIPQFAPDWPGLVVVPVFVDNSGWFVIFANTDVGLAGNYPDNAVLIARLAIETDGGDCVSGVINFQYVDGASGQTDAQVLDAAFEHCFEGACMSDADCAASTGPCDGGEFCNVDTGECLPNPDPPVSTMCEADGNLCTLDHCDGEGSCVQEGVVECLPGEGPCDGGQVCEPDTGECIPAPDPGLSTMCELDGDLCTIDHCDGAGNCVFLEDVECPGSTGPCDGGEVCNPDTGECDMLPDEPMSTLCEADGDLCTLDHCDGSGSCVQFDEVVCDPAIPPCEAGQTCEPATGECVDLPDAPLSTDCDADGDGCTIDHCDGEGSCVFVEDVVCPGPMGECDAGQECNPANGMCEDLPDPAMSTTCEADGDLCTIDHCDGSGACVFLEDVVCEGPSGPCDGGQECVDGECVDLPDEPMSTMCEADGDLCTNDHCDGAGMCVFESDVECPEGEHCEDGECVPDAVGAAFLDFKPGACPNPWNPNSNGVLPTSLLGTDEFDVSLVDLSSLLLSRADGVGGSVAPNEGPPGPHSTYGDLGTPFDGELCDCHHAGPDGTTDLNMKFRSSELSEVLELGDVPTGEYVELVLTGMLLDGTPFSASDCVRIVGAGNGPDRANVSVESNVFDSFILVTPLDVYTDGNGFTGMDRTYLEGTTVTLTAPEFSDPGFGSTVVQWVIDGQVQPLGVRTVEIITGWEVTNLQLLYLRNSGQIGGGGQDAE